jgi:hypothetical protein
MDVRNFGYSGVSEVTVYENAIAFLFKCLIFLGDQQGKQGSTGGKYWY